MNHKIADTISYIPSQENPLSSDVAIIKGKKIYLFDVGSSDVAFEDIQMIDGDKCAIISHFHPDHIGNLTRLTELPIYVSTNTFKYTNRGTIIEKDIILEEGIVAFLIPSSHAKGSLGLIVNDEYVFIGDALAPSMKKGKVVYNAQLVLECIRLFKSIEAPYFIQSHRMNRVDKKEEVIEKLDDIYAQRKGQESYIEIEDWHD